MIGQPAPRFHLPDADGNVTTFEELLDRPLLLIFARHLH